jgi:N-hydroxyarylamine O-acetyltransferase
VRDGGSELALVQHEASDPPHTAYALTLRPRAFEEYEPMCVYQQTSPESHFTRRRICSLATPGGRVSLANDRLIVTTREGRRETPVPEHERAEVLQREFGVVLGNGN